MGAISTIGLDLAKNSSRFTGFTRMGGAARRRLRRGDVLKFFKAVPPRLVGIEACATAHHWGRQISAWACGEADAASLRRKTEGKAVLT
jgi:transposase